MKNEIFMEISQELRLEVFSFVNSKELFCMSLTSRYWSSLIEPIFREEINKYFPEYLRDGELKQYQGQDLKILYFILFLYHRFSARIHLHNTPYYLQLIDQIIGAFLARKKMPLKNFPWAAYILGNLARLLCKDPAYYFKMAITAEPPLELAKFVSRAIKLLGDQLEFEDKAAICLAAAMQNDFIYSYGKLFGRMFFSPSVYDVYPKGSFARFEFLEKSHEYLWILLGFESFKEIINKTREQLLEGWFKQMEEEKDPIVASQIAAGLMEINHSGLNAFEYKENQEDQDVAIMKCIQKGGFNFRAVCVQYGIAGSIRLLEFIISKKIALRPGGLGACLMELGDIYVNNKWGHFDLQKAQDYYWRAIREGQPEALAKFNIVISSVENTNRALYGKPEKLFLFKDCFAAQQDTRWISYLMGGKVHIGLETLKFDVTAAFIRLHCYATVTNNADVRITANAALGLFFVSRRDYKEAANCFNEARKNTSLFQEYFTFVREQGYLLLPEDLRFVQRFLDTSSISDNKEYFLVRLVRREPPPLAVPAPVWSPGALKSSRMQERRNPENPAPSGCVIA
jgi:F-box domain